MAVIQVMAAGIQCRRTIEAKWEGEHLLVHRPMTYNKETETLEISRAKKFWQITHRKSGMAAGGGGINARLADVIALARLWDGSFKNVTPRNSQNWRLGEQWKIAIRVLENTGTVKPPVNTTWRKN
jgi:hypothetical protein